MTVLTEGLHAGEALGQMAMPLGYHTETVTLLAGTSYKANAVLGRVTASGKYTTYDNGASNGTEAAARILVYPVDATAADATGVVVKRGPMQVNKNDLFWGANNGAGILAGIADLDALGIQAL